MAAATEDKGIILSGATSRLDGWEEGPIRKVVTDLAYTREALKEVDLEAQ